MNEIFYKKIIKETYAVNGKKLLARRREKGFTLQILANKVGCAISFISSLEIGRKKSITIELGNKIMEALK